MTKKKISDEDKALFREAMRSVTPLHQKNKPHSSSEKSNDPSYHPSRSDLPLSDFVSEEVHTDTILLWFSVPLPKNRQKALSHGKIPWQARLDLHGMTVEQARTKLCDFIQEQCEQRHRCVLIIHGKGSLHNEPPILKNKINTWLKQFPQVLAYHSAIPKHGGTGAVYVLLK